MYQWHQFKPYFDVDGSLRDIYIENVHPPKWGEFLDFIKSSNYAFEFKHGERLINIPDNFSSIKALQEQDPTILCIKLHDKLSLHCYFFIETEIELDLSPCDINGESDFKLLLSFLEHLSESLASRVILTPEDTPKDILLSYGDEFV